MLEYTGFLGAVALVRTLLNTEHMALPIDQSRPTNDPRAVAILAKTIYRELRAAGYAERDVMSLASELLGMVATDVKGRRAGA